MDLQAIYHPALERLWIEEVRHLHSLWYQGPPQNPSSPNPNFQNPKSPNPNPNPNLRASNSISLKNEKIKKKKKKKKKGNSKKLDSDEKPAKSEIEWPCEPPRPERQPESSWAVSKTPVVSRPASDEEQAVLVGVRLQQKGVKACQDFFSKKSGNEDEAEDEDEDEDDEDEGGRESPIYEFFLGVFKEDGELRGYYEKNWKDGGFYCLVCEGVTEKKGKQYKGCFALVQHSTKISKTKSKDAHRAYGQVLCRVLGWDISRFPSIVLDSNGPLGRSLDKAESQNSDEQSREPEIEWPCEPLPERQPESGWPVSKMPAAVTRPASDKEQAKLVAVKLQQRGVKVCEDFFSKKNSSSGNEEEAEDEEEDLMDDEDGDDRESMIYEFLIGIFKEDGELRGYYEKNCEGGEFCCLVCEGIKEKKGKRYKDCVALVQHSSSISKTKSKDAHRAYGRVVCRVLGWDISRLPSIVLDSSEPLGRLLAKAESQAGSKEDDAIGEKDDAHNEEVDLKEADNGETMDCNAGLKEDGAVNQKEDTHKESAGSMETDDGKLLDCKVQLKEDESIDPKEDLQKEAQDSM